MRRRYWPIWSSFSDKSWRICGHSSVRGSRQSWTSCRTTTMWVMGHGWNIVESLTPHSDGLLQDCSNSSALAMELQQSYPKPSIYSWTLLITWFMKTYHTSSVTMTSVGYRSGYKCSKDVAYLVLMGELWTVLDQNNVMYHILIIVIHHLSNHLSYVIFSLYPPLQRSWKEGCTGFTLSLCPSVCPSVDRIMSALYLQQYLSDPFHICTSYQATSEGVSLVMFFRKFKNLKFWRILLICNFDFVFFWLGIQ